MFRLLFALLTLVASVPGQSYCSWSTFSSVYCFGGGFNTLGVFPASPVIGGSLTAEAIRASGTLDTVAALICRSLAPATPTPFPLDPAAGNILLDVAAPNVIDVSVMNTGAAPGISWTAPVVWIPNDPGLVGLTVYSQAFLLDTAGAWRASWCVMRMIG